MKNISILAISILTISLAFVGCDVSKFCRQQFESAPEVAACDSGAGDLAAKILKANAPSVPTEESAQESCTQRCASEYPVQSEATEVGRIFEACSLSCQTRIALQRYRHEQAQSQQGG